MLLAHGELKSEDALVCTVTSLQKAIKKHSDRTMIALEKELAGLIVDGRPVIKPIKANEMKTPPIPASTKSKEKFLSDGTFDKDKVRICAMGNFVREKLGKHRTSSPTVDTSSVMAHLQKVPMHNLYMMVVDIDTAYFNAELQREVNMILGKTETAVLMKLRPDWKSYVRHDGTVLVRIIRALYGLPECSKLFYDFMCQVFVKLGFKKSEVDPAVFIKMMPTELHDLVVTMHVDDLLITASSIEALELIASQLQKSTIGITFKISG